jgi:hypothetical protein
MYIINTQQNDWRIKQCLYVTTAKKHLMSPKFGLKHMGWIRGYTKTLLDVLIAEEHLLKHTGAIVAMNGLLDRTLSLIAANVFAKNVILHMR